MTKTFPGRFGLIVVALMGLLLPVLPANLSLPAPAATESRTAFLNLIERPRVPVAPVLKELPSVDGLAHYHFTFASEATQRVPGLLVKPAPAAGRRPVVVALHGTGGNKEGQLPLLRELARRGFIGVAIDGRYHGERTRSGKGSEEYVAAIGRAYHKGQEYPFLYDTVWDILRLVDFLATQPEVDPQRIGLIGFSKGGMETYLAAAVEPRIAVAVPCIGVQSFRWALANNAWQSRVETFQAAIDSAAKAEGVMALDAAFVRRFYDRVVPGIYDQFDAPAMLPLIAPRSLLVINGDQDPRTPLPGLQECVTAAERAYQQAGAAERFRFYLQAQTGHKVTPAAQAAALDWFARWLKP